MKKIVMLMVSLLTMEGVLLAGSASQNSGGPAALVRLPGFQSDGTTQTTPDYGTVATSAYTVVAHGFRPISSVVTYEYGVFDGNIGIYRTNATGTVYFEAPIHLPTGVLITSVEFRFCDTSATRGFGSFLTINNKAGILSQPLLVESSVAETPGCINRTFTFSSPLLIDNDSNAYSLEVNMGAGGPGDNNIVLCQARIYYKRQVSPAPAVATFPNDVPTSHPFFRFVEALASSGITAGCGSGSYCPDQPITRGQMAVFLATALGLHWPN